MELRQLRYFLAVADNGHVGRGAQQLHLAQQTVSAAIANLEKELGVRLFERLPRGVILTEAGAVLVTHARNVVAAAEATTAAVLAHREGLAGTLKLGVLLGGHSDLLLDILSAFRRRAPNANLVVQNMLTTDIVEAIVQARLDAAVVWGPVADERVDVVELATAPRVALISARNPRADAAELSLFDLLEMRHAAHVPGEPESWDAFWNLVPERNSDEPERLNVPMTADVYNQLLTIAMHDLLITLPQPAAATLPPHQFGARYVPVVDLSPAPLNLVTRRGTTSNLVQSFKDVAVVLAKGRMAESTSLTREQGNPTNTTSDP